MKKLTLNKEVIANLCSQEMNVVKGLSGNTCVGTQCAINSYVTCISCVETCDMCPTTGDTCVC